MATCFNTSASDMKVLDDQTLTLLGGALAQEPTDALLERQAHNLQRMCNKLTDLPHHQSLTY